MTAYTYRGRPVAPLPGCRCGHTHTKRRESVVRVVALNESTVRQAVVSNA